MTNAKKGKSKRVTITPRITLTNGNLIWHFIRETLDENGQNGKPLIDKALSDALCEFMSTLATTIDVKNKTLGRKKCTNIL